jgi:hypothetical protein
MPNELAPLRDALRESLAARLNGFYLEGGEDFGAPTLPVLVTDSAEANAFSGRQTALSSMLKAGGHPLEAPYVLRQGIQALTLNRDYLLATRTRLNRYADCAGMANFEIKGGLDAKFPE